MKAKLKLGACILVFLLCISLANAISSEALHNKIKGIAEDIAKELYAKDEGTSGDTLINKVFDGKDAEIKRNQLRSAEEDRRKSAKISTTIGGGTGEVGKEEVEEAQPEEVEKPEKEPEKEEPEKKDEVSEEEAKKIDDQITKAEASLKLAEQYKNQKKKKEAQDELQKVSSFIRDTDFSKFNGAQKQRSEAILSRYTTLGTEIKKLKDKNVVDKAVDTAKGLPKLALILIILGVGTLGVLGARAGFKGIKKAVEKRKAGGRDTTDTSQKEAEVAQQQALVAGEEGVTPEQAKQYLINLSNNETYYSRFLEHLYHNRQNDVKNLLGSLNHRQRRSILANFYSLHEGASLFSSLFRSKKVFESLPDSAVVEFLSTELPVNVEKWKKFLNILTPKQAKTLYDMLEPHMRGLSLT